MTIDNNIEQRLESLFPGVILDKTLENELLIRTNNWHILPTELAAIREMGLNIDGIYTEGGGVITLVIDKKSSKKAIRK